MNTRKEVTGTTREEAVEEDDDEEYDETDEAEVEADVKEVVVELEEVRPDYIDDDEGERVNAARRLCFICFLYCTSP